MSSIRRLKRMGLCLSLIFYFCSAHAQSSDELRKQQESISKEIKKIETILETNEKSRELTLGELQLTQQKLKLRKELLSSIGREIKATDNSINRLSYNIKKTEQLLDTLKERYKKSVINFYKNNDRSLWVKYFLNNKSINDGIRLFIYFKAYEESQKEQAKKISSVKQELETQLYALNKERNNKNRVALNQKKEMRALQKEERTQAVLSKQLQAKSNSLRKQIKDRVKKQQSLKNAIAKAIKQEMEAERRRILEEMKRKKAEEDAKKSAANTAAPSSSTENPTNPKKSAYPSDIDISKIEANFIRQKGKMPWPVKGVILSSYGSDIFEGSSVSGRNIGTIFRTTENASVSSIADGIISSSVLFQGIYTIIIKHGSYFSGYSNLSAIYVKRGDLVSGGDAIGAAAKSEDGDWGEVVLQIADIKGNVNPEDWMKK